MEKTKASRPKADQPLVEIKQVNRKKRTGKVVSKKSPQLAIVEMERLRKHPYYLKRYKVHHRLAVHDEKDVCKKGDLVEIEECRPISKTKRWKIIEIIK